MQSSREPDFFVGDWRARPSLGQVERGDLQVDVEARSMQVLVCLARHAPNVVSKQRLIREIWGESFVTEEVLSHAIWELRKAFGDDARNPRYIQTIAKKGYRLLAEVSRRVAPKSLGPGDRVGHYEILEQLGGGAMGEVYKARDVRLGRVVALKFLPADLARDPSSRRRFLHEARALASLDHPNVATLYEVAESEDGRMYLSMAFCEGETLQTRLERGPLPLSEAVAIARQIAQGLAAAHHLHIVHRDVKPSNVIILPDGKVKLLDFGLAKMTGATALTRLGSSSPGTPAYKSPEQTKGDKVDPRSDLWALGVVLYEMVAGRTPFGGEYESAIIHAILNEPPRPLDGGFPPELTSVIERTLAKDPANRYATAEEFEEGLARIPLGGEPRREEARTRPLPLPRPGRRVLWIAAVLILLLVVGGIAWAWWRQAHRWDFSPEVERLVEQGESVEWRGDTERTFDNAEQVYRQALAQSQGNPRIEAQLAALLARKNVQFPAPGQMEEIRRLTADAERRAPDDPMPWVAQAKLLLLENKPKEAEEAARRAIDRDPDFDRGHTQLGEALIAQGKKDAGFIELRRAADMKQGYVRARLTLAAKLQDATRYDEAAAEFLKVLDFDREHPTAKENLGDIYFATGRYSDAIPLLREVFETTHDFRAANSLGNNYFGMGRMEEAINAYKNAYAIKPSPTVARNLGEAYEKFGRKDEARQWYQRAISTFDKSIPLGGQRADFLYGRSYCVAKLGRYDEALQNIQEAIRLKPNQNAFVFRVAQIYAMEGRREEAYAWTRKAIEAGYSREDVGRDTTFRDFQNDPQFQEILEAR